MICSIIGCDKTIPKDKYGTVCDDHYSIFIECYWEGEWVDFHTGVNLSREKTSVDWGRAWKQFYEDLGIQE